MGYLIATSIFIARECGQLNASALPIDDDNESVALNAVTASADDYVQVFEMIRELLRTAPSPPLL